MKILIVEDEVQVAKVLQKGLREEGHAVDISHDGEDGGFLAEVNDYDLIILDLMLPKKNGIQVCREIRTRGVNTPVLMLTARGEDVDRIVGLEVGADDYLAKPFNTRELVARIKAVLRRSPAGARAQSAAGTLVAGPLVLEPSSLTARLDDKPLTLTGAEFRVLENLVTHAGQIVSRETLTENALGRRLEAFDRAIDTHVSNLRRKLGTKHNGVSPIRNVRGAGYLLSFALPAGEHDDDD